MDKKRYKISLILNIIIIALVIIASIIMFNGYKFMEGNTKLECSGFGMLKFFTIDSNILMGIVSLIFAIKEYQFLKGKIDGIPSSVYILKLMATTSVSITFSVVFVYLAPLFGSVYAMIMNANLFFHFLIPIFSIINFTIFEINNKIKAKYSFFGLIPFAIYSFCYLINILLHIKNGAVSSKYDWYYFVQNGIVSSLTIVFTILIICYTINFLLWRINKGKL